jgi:uncharacterized RDD family membrane protein YckC
MKFFFLEFHLLPNLADTPPYQFLYLFFLFIYYYYFSLPLADAGQHHSKCFFLSFLLFPCTQHVFFFVFFSLLSQIFFSSFHHFLHPDTQHHSSSLSFFIFFSSFLVQGCVPAERKIYPYIYIYIYIYIKKKIILKNTHKLIHKNKMNQD